jgi:hypothetical protein
VQDNAFYDTDSTWPWEAVKAESGLETGGIRMYGPMNGRGTVIRHNTFHDYFDGFGVCPDESAAVTNETDVYANLVYNAGDDGMETDGQCSNVRIWKNTFHDVLAGISLAPVYTGPVYAFRNLIYRTGVGETTASLITAGTSVRPNPSSTTRLTPSSRQLGLAIMSPGSWKLIHARNNIWSGTEYAVNNANPGQPIDFDRDDLYTTQAGELVWWDGLADSHLRTLDEVRAATDQEQHGLAVAPGFVDAASGAYAPGPAASHRPGWSSGINDDHEGAADIGAYESPRRRGHVVRQREGAPPTPRSASARPARRRPSRARARGAGAASARTAVRMPTAAPAAPGPMALVGVGARRRTERVGGRRAPPGAVAARPAVARCRWPR